MPTPRVPAAADGMPTVRNLIFDAEADMLKVRDLARILHSHMSEASGIDPEMTGALSWLTAELLEIGERLKGRHEAIFEAVVGEAS